MRFVLTFIVCFISYFQIVYAGTPHLIHGKLINTDGSIPANQDITYSVFILGNNQDNILTESNTGCGYMNGNWWLEVGNFQRNWSIGDVLYIDINNTNGQNYNAYILLNGKGSQLCSFPLVNEGPPIADAGPDQTAKIGTAVQLNASNSYDPDVKIAIYSWEQKEGYTVELSNSQSANPTFIAPRINNDNYCLVFELTVTDHGLLTSKDTCIINITDENLSPIANAGLDKTVNTGDEVLLDASDSFDPNDEIESYLWEQTFGPRVSLSGETSVKSTFIAPSAGETGTVLSFQLTVNDQENLRSIDTCNIIVINNNMPPIADAGNDQSVKESDLVILDASNSSDPDFQPVIYLWKQTRGCPITLSDINTKKTSFIAPPVDDLGIKLDFKITITDDKGLQAEDDVTININDNGISGFPDNALTFKTLNGKSIGVYVSDGDLIKFDIISLSEISDSNNKPVNMLYDLFDMNIKTYYASATATVKFYLLEPIPAGYNWFKYSIKKGWNDYSSFTSVDSNNKQLTITLVDGDIGDDDQENGIIVDPSGLGTLISPKQNPPPKSGDSGGGCFIQLLKFERKIYISVLILILLITFYILKIKFKFLEKENMLQKSIKYQVLIILTLLFFITFSKIGYTESMTFSLKKGLNGISIPYKNTGINNAEELINNIVHCEKVQYWDASKQKYISHEKGSDKNIFFVTSGNPYFVSVTEDSELIVTGDFIDNIEFDLISTSKSNINAIAVPIYRVDFENAEQIINEIPGCTAIWYWDSDKQGLIGHPIATEINNFSIKPGYPYFVHVNENVTWEVRTSPNIHVVTPLNGTVSYTSPSIIKIAYNDKKFGIDEASLNIKINGVDKTNLFTVSSEGAYYTVDSKLPLEKI